MSDRHACALCHDDDHYHFRVEITKLWGQCIMLPPEVEIEEDEGSDIVEQMVVVAELEDKGCVH